mgnify:CR=1 FL=1
MSAPLLRAEGLEIAFAGVKAADGVDLSIHEGEFLAIIGPNGSGKTTFLNICTGYLRPARGEVYLDGAPITGLSPRRIARRGIARAFQIPQLFVDQTLLDNVMLSVAARHGPFEALRPLARATYRSEAMELLDLFGLAAQAGQVTGTLPEGLRKLADIALALALRPRLLLLDEPTSGVSAIERFFLMDTLMAALRETGVTALFVEHDMEVVARYANRVMVWDSGRVMAEGAPDVVLKDPRVLESVVGMD